MQIGNRFVILAGVLVAAMLAMGTARADSYTDLQRERVMKLCAWEKLNKAPANVKPHELCGIDVQSMQGSPLATRMRAYFDEWEAKYPLSQAFTKFIGGEEVNRESVDESSIAERKRIADEKRAQNEERIKQRAATEKSRREAFVANIKTASESALCGEFRSNKSDAALAELGRRGFTAKEVDAVRGKRFFIGMSQRALLCSLGPAQARNRTVVANGEHIQWIYRGTYIYTDNGVVTSFQD